MYFVNARDLGLQINSDLINHISFEFVFHLMTLPALDARRQQFIYIVSNATAF